MQPNLSLRSIAAMALLAALSLSLVGAARADAKPKKPSKSVVKRVMTEVWDTDGTGPDRTTLEFKKIKVKPMRRRHVNEFAPSDWVSPVKVVLIQTIVYGDGPGMRDVARITQKALFYRETSWWYHSKGADVDYIERM
jgi:hypothetical protein